MSYVAQWKKVPENLSILETEGVPAGEYSGEKSYVVRKTNSTEYGLIVPSKKVSVFGGKEITSTGYEYLVKPGNKAVKWDGVYYSNIGQNAASFENSGRMSYLGRVNISGNPYIGFTDPEKKNLSVNFSDKINTFVLFEVLTFN